MTRAPPAARGVLASRRPGRRLRKSRLRSAPAASGGPSPASSAASRTRSIGCANGCGIGRGIARGEPVGDRTRPTRPRRGSRQRRAARRRPRPAGLRDERGRRLGPAVRRGAAGPHPGRRERRGPRGAVPRHHRPRHLRWRARPPRASRSRPASGRRGPPCTSTTRARDGATVISEFRLDPNDTGRLDPASERVILTEPQPYPNHNGGWIGFDADRDAADRPGRRRVRRRPREPRLGPGHRSWARCSASTCSTRPSGQAYAIPADNPYAGRTDARPEILHSGLRNPFRVEHRPGHGRPVDRRRGPERVGGGRHRPRRRPRPRLRLAALGGPALLRTRDRLRSGGGHDARDGVRARGRVLGDRRGGLPRPGDPGAAGRVPVLGLLLRDAVGDRRRRARRRRRRSPCSRRGRAISSISTGEDGEVYLTDLSRGSVLRLVAGG